MQKRIHILGASGSGVTTLGVNISTSLNIKHLDTDNFYWKKTTLPFTRKQPIPERLAGIDSEIEGLENWVLSGSLCSWGEPLIEYFTHVIFLWIPWEVRKERLRKREVARYGEEALLPDGEMHGIYAPFMDWTSKYDTAGREQRSRLVHEEWLRELAPSIKIIQFVGEYDEKILLGEALKGMGHL